MTLALLAADAALTTTPGQRKFLTALTLAEPPRFQDSTLPDTD